MQENTQMKRWMSAGALLSVTGLTGCIAVGYSSGHGWFLWPGGLGLLLVIVLILALLRRR